jgi:hypothetical protein
MSRTLSLSESVAPVSGEGAPETGSETVSKPISRADGIFGAPRKILKYFASVREPSE